MYFQVKKTEKASGRVALNPYDLSESLMGMKLYQNNKQFLFKLKRI